MSKEQYYSGLLYGKYKSRPAIQTINRFLNSDLYFLVLAGLCAVAFGYSLELPVYTVYAVVIFWIVLLGQRLSRILPVIPFFYIAPSVIHNPAQHEESIFLDPGCLIYMGVLGVLLAALLGAVVIRAAKNGPRRKCSLWLGYLLLGAAYVCSGLGSDGASAWNAGFGLVEFLSISILYFAGVFLIDASGADRDLFAKIGCSVGLTLIIEMVAIYIFSSIFAQGYLNRSNLYTGWGMYNNVGNLLCACIPCAFYAMYRSEKRRSLWFLYACLLALAVVSTTSRSSILTGAGIFLLSLTVTLIKLSRPRLTGWVVLAMAVMLGLAAGGCIFLWGRYDAIRLTVEKVLKTDIFNDSGRFEAWADGIRQFLENPSFGKGFYACTAYLYGDGVAGLLPARWHNLYIQLLASCGAVGGVAYLIHRFQTLRLFWRLRTAEGWFIGLGLLAILIGSFTDNHFFNIGPGLFYGLFLAAADAQLSGRKSASGPAADN